MADILAALEELDGQNKKPTNKKVVNPLKSSTSRSRSQRNSRINARPPSPPSGRLKTPTNGDRSRPQSRSSPTHNNLLSPSLSYSDPDASERSPSVASARRISFAEPPPPPSTRRRLRLTTNKEKLTSGFKFDPTLTRYNVSEMEWSDFSDAVIGAVHIPKRARIAWPLYKKDIAKRVKKDLQYEGGALKRQINIWNRHFRRRGFTVSMEVPGPVRVQDHASAEDRELAAKEAKFFRMVLTPVSEKGTSIYSRTSSLTRSVSGEAAALAVGKAEIESDDHRRGSNHNDNNDDDDDDDDDDDSEDGMGRAEETQQRQQMRSDELADKLKALQANQVDVKDHGATAAG